ncbi:hypothetical protein GCM10009688_16420 [Arthrobacter gandavensis]|uniref:Uncharacterized protein n=1 Tax=Arthrobacter gandavensis TaxID=169960 RepID=A0ABP5AHK5_9MICC
MFFRALTELPAPGFPGVGSWLCACQHDTKLPEGPQMAGRGLGAFNAPAAVMFNNATAALSG